MDICFEVIKVQYQDEKHIKMKGYWVNIGYIGEPFRLELKYDRPDKLTLITERFDNWICINRYINNPRTMPGLPKELKNEFSR